MAVIGLIPTAAIFVVVFMRLEGPERWTLVIPYVVVLLVSASTSPSTSSWRSPGRRRCSANWFPALKAIPSV